MDPCENEVICKELGMLSMSSGIDTDISNKHAVGPTDSPATFFRN